MNKYEAKKFKVGDKVWITKPHSDGKNYEKNRIYVIEKMGKSFANKGYVLSGMPCICWYDDELESAGFEEGDIVKLNPDARLKDFAYDDNRVLVFSGTEKMFSGENCMYFNRNYEVELIESVLKDRIRLKGLDGLFESSLFIFVRRPGKVKEVTMAEVEERFGCKVKIVKGNKQGDIEI